MSSSENAPKVYLGVPCYDGRIEAASVQAIFGALKQGVTKINMRGHSLLAFNFNFFWCEALNARKNEGITHFAMMHDDVVPEANWMKKLIEEMETNKAHMISAVVPIKSSEGLTSTGIDMESEVNPWAVRKLTMKEIYDQPETFTHENLVLNTGLMLIDMRPDEALGGDWASKFLFTIKDQIVQRDNGDYYPIVESEDWGFSRALRKMGGRVFATRKIKVNHVGRQIYSNGAVYGTAKMDPAWCLHDSLETKDKSHLCGLCGRMV